MSGHDKVTTTTQMTGRRLTMTIALRRHDTSTRLDDVSETPRLGDSRLRSRRLAHPDARDLTACHARVIDASKGA